MMKTLGTSADRRQRDFYSCLRMEPMLSHEFDFLSYRAIHSKVGKDLEKISPDLKLYFTSSEDWQGYEKEAHERQYSFEDQKIKSSNRLGLYFESLLEIWLRNNCYFKIVASHVALHHEQSRKTLGEIDWLLENQQTHELEHWECAVKFFLVQPGCQNLYALRGTGLKDTLGNKLDHIFSHQLQQSLSPEFAAAFDGIKVTKHVCLIKGMLFFEWQAFRKDSTPEPLQKLPPALSHFLNFKAQFSYWLGQAELHDYFHESTHRKVERSSVFCIMLERLEWLTPLDHSDILQIMQHSIERVYSCEALFDWVATCNSSCIPQSPVMIAIIARKNHSASRQPSNTEAFLELNRFFLVTHEWRERFQNATFT